MSHFSKIQTKISNKEFLVNALDKMKYQYSVGNHNCKGYQGITYPVEILITLPNTSYGIGFTNNNGFYELVADWYGIHNVNSSDFIRNIEDEIVKIENKIKQQYAYETTVKSLINKGFTIAEESNDNGEIHIKLRRLV